MKVYICNAFSLSMLDRQKQLTNPRRIIPLKVEDVKTILSMRDVETVAAVGHLNTAQIIAEMLNLPVEKVYDRKTIKLGDKDGCIIAQYVGPRLPEGATELPEGATIEWWGVSQAE